MHRRPDRIPQLRNPRLSVWVRVMFCVILAAGEITAAVVPTSSSAPAPSRPAHTSLVTTIACDQSSCSGPYSRPVTVTFSTTGGEPGDTQVTGTYYTTDGSTPTVSSTMYTGPFKVSKPTTIRFFSTDLFGNAGQVKTKQIEVKAGAGQAKPHKPERYKPGQTVVSFTFDDAYENQWLYSAPLLRSHHMTATYYAITIDEDLSHMCCMSWEQLEALQAEGNDIGGHTITHPRLTTLNRDRVKQEICGGRQDLIKNGIVDPRSLAYPFGSYNATAESVAHQCGYTTARAGGGISDSNTIPGPPYAETIPPRDPYALSTIAPNGSQPIKLPVLKAYVSAAAANGGGWLVITFHDVCQAKAADYAHCMSTYGPVQDTVFGQFLNWLQSTGKLAGAPSGVIVRNVCQVMNCP
jgi:peptidoglycan/xylan/chitin deacetylase (PgdA/CDA1 family)